MAEKDHSVTKKIRVRAIHPGVREWISGALAFSLGPIFMLSGYSLNLVFGAAGGFYVIVCVLVVPLLIFSAGRIKVLVWQLAIMSLVVSILGDNVRIHAIYRNEIMPVAYVFWAFGSLLSAPLPVYLFLRPKTVHRRYMWGLAIVAVVVVLLLGLKRFGG